MTGVPATVFERLATERRSLENPSTPLSAPDDWLYDALGSFRASSGVNVNSQTALSYDPWWRGVNLISADIGRLPFHKYTVAGRGRELDLDHPAYYLMRYKPNSEMTASVFRQTLQHHVLANGNGYAYIERDKAGRPIQLIPLNPTQIYPIRANGQLWYVIDIPTMEMWKELPENIFHLKGLSYDGLIGYSVIAKARESLGEGMAMQTYSSIFYRNNAQPRVVLVIPHTMEPTKRQQLRESWERMHAGLENAHRTAVLDGGLDIKTISMNARDSQLIEGRRFSVKQCANWLGVPPSKLGERESSSYNSLEMEQQAYLEEGLAPWFIKWEEEAWDKLLSEREKRSGRHHFGFDARALVRANLQARGEYFTKALTGGWMNPDQVREEEGLNPREDPDGAKYAQDLRFAWVGGKEEDAPDATPADAQGDPGAELLDVPDIRQQDNYSCGAACAMAVGKYFGVGPDSLEEWKTALGTTPQDSTRPMRIVEYLADCGLVVTAANNLTVEDLQACWKRGEPVICPIQEYGVPSKQASFAYGHYVVVIGAALGHVFVQDPSIDNVLEGQDSDQALGQSLIKEEDFLNVWHDKDADGKEYVCFGIAVGQEMAPPPPPPEPPAADKKPAPANKGQPPPATDKNDQDPNRARALAAHRSLLVNALRRMVKRIGTQARRAARKPDFSAWCRSIDTEHAGVITEALAPVLEVIQTLTPQHDSAAELAGDLLADVRAQLLAAEKEYASGDLDQAVDRVMAAGEAAIPEALADEVLARQKPDEPGRTPEQALEILNRMPDADPDNPGTVQLLFPVDENPQFPNYIDAKELADAKVKAVKLRKLIGTHPRLGRKLICQLIKDPAGAKIRELAGLPTDRPYVVRCNGLLYIYDGHHRLMAKQLLGVNRAEVYFYDWDKAGKG